MLMAAGLDPERCILFRQSDVREHTELTWLLSSVTAYGDLQRMHQFKDKSARQQELVSAGLFLYPVLQAADILLYKTDQVPVGDDQRQHLELAREIARRFNATYGEVLVEAEHVIPEVGARIMDLQEPTMKMSTTSSSEAGRIYIDEEPAAILKKVKRAQTDSGREVVRAPGQARHHEPDRACSPSPAGSSRSRSSASSRARATARSRARWGRRWSSCLTPVRERYTELRADERTLEARSVAGRGAGPRDRGRRRWPRCARPWASARSAPAARASRLPPVTLANLDLDLEVFQGPFDLLLTLVLQGGGRPARGRPRRGRARLRRAPRADRRARPRGGDRVPGADRGAAGAEVAADAAGRGGRGARPRPGGGRRGAARADARVPALQVRRRAPARALEAEHGHRYRSAPLPPELRRVSLEVATAAYEPEQLGAALGGLLRIPPPIDLRHVRRPAVSVEQRLHHLRDLLRARRGFSFDDAVKGADRLTEAVTLFALLELYKAGEASWEQDETFGPITVRAVERSTT